MSAIMIKRTGVISLLCLAIWSCKTESTPYTSEIDNPQYYHNSLKQLTDIIVHDIFSPPVASRIYAYSNIAAYEVLVLGYPEYQSLANQLNELTPIPAPDTTKQIDFHLAAIHAFLTVGKALIFSEEKMDAFRENLHADFKKGSVPEEIYLPSIAYGEKVAEHILTWAAKDNYKQTRSMPKYTIRQEDAYWKPTPPDYMEGIEPHWNKIRPFVMDSASQFKPAPAHTFDMRAGSTFYKEVMEVYEVGQNLKDESLNIAKFWDCNPYVSHVQGHAMFATKKITPGGHWMGITGIATQKAKANFVETVAAYTMISISLFDGFISCWDEKWRSVVIRPETVINKYVDEDWVPLLQTPPFPEYTSGHSVISNASAEVLTHLYGDNFAFRDTSEVEYGLPERSFTSFRHAGDEASLSRLYGGIHYRQAIEEGVKQGKKVGNLVIQQVKIKNNLK
ncbi:MAG: vanadium-dependent haloperoxidase [Saprospiraceae bacterium]|nr:vanadium-dependent haloperoxidase [Saprospiraceae bacterium]